MNLVHHKNLSIEKWFSKTLPEQMSNIGSEVNRTITWRQKDKKYSQLAFERALELIDLTREDPKNSPRLRELGRVREIFVDWFFENEYETPDKSWDSYFLPFNYLARKDA